MKVFISLFSLPLRKLIQGSFHPKPIGQRHYK
jgi:hypothetical protein